MTTLRRLVATALVAAGIAASSPPSPAAGAAEGAARVPGGAGIAVRLDPASHLFGDRVAATVEVLVDARRVDPDTVKLRVDFAPYGFAGPPAIRKHEAAGVLVLTHRYRLLCLREACRPPAGRARTFRFRPARLSFLRRDGRAGQLAARWFPLTAGSRLTPGTVLRADWQARAYPPPAVSYRFHPRLLSALLFVATALLAVAGGALVLRSLSPLLAARLSARRRRRLRPAERELMLLRDALARREEGAARKALDSLALALGANGDEELARGARRLAWSERDPIADGALALAHEVESRIAGGGR